MALHDRYCSYPPERAFSWPTAHCENVGISCAADVSASLLKGSHVFMRYPAHSKTMCSEKTWQNTGCISKPWLFNVVCPPTASILSVAW